MASVEIPEPVIEAGAVAEWDSTRGTTYPVITVYGEEVWRGEPIHATLDLDGATEEAKRKLVEIMRKVARS